MTLYIGTSGWAYKEWRPSFYPEGLPQSQFLTHYSSVLSACEINATFYRLQSDETFARWLQSTPDHFKFCTKAHRRITHAKEVAGDMDFLSAFMKSVASLADRLGVVLFQFPPYRRRDDDTLGRLLDSLPGDGRYAFEFRHESWDTDATRASIAERGSTVCFAETEGRVPPALPPGPFGYVRLRSERYGESERAQWRTLLTEEAKTRDVFAFTKHEGIPAEDPYGGIGLAAWLSKTAAPPPSA